MYKVFIDFCFFEDINDWWFLEKQMFIRRGSRDSFGEDRVLFEMWSKWAGMAKSISSAPHKVFSISRWSSIFRIFFTIVDVNYFPNDVLTVGWKVWGFLKRPVNRPVGIAMIVMRKWSESFTENIMVDGIVRPKSTQSLDQWIYRPRWITSLITLSSRKNGIPAQ